MVPIEFRKKFEKYIKTHLHIFWPIGYSIVVNNVRKGQGT